MADSWQLADELGGVCARLVVPLDRSVEVPQRRAVLRALPVVRLVRVPSGEGEVTTCRGPRPSALLGQVGAARPVAAKVLQT